MPIIEISSLTHPGVDVFCMLTDAQLRQRMEPGNCLLYTSYCLLFGVFMEWLSKKTGEEVGMKGKLKILSLIHI